MYDNRQKNVDFLLVYIREAHALDSPWPDAAPDGVCVEDAATLAERSEHASSCVSTLELATIPALVDDMSDTANRLYDAWPDRLVLIDRTGRIAYRSAPGPYGFEPQELADAITQEMQRERNVQ